MSLQQLRSVFCTCFANTDEHATQSRSPCTASQVKKTNKQTNKQQKKTSPKPQAGAGRPLPSLLKAVPEAGWFGRERNAKLRALHAHPPTWLPSSSPFPHLSVQRRLVPATPPFSPPKPPPSHPSLPKFSPGEGADESDPSGGGRLGKRRPPLCPGWVPAQPPACPKSIWK